jgi:uncharacterized membrane protein
MGKNIVIGLLRFSAIGCGLIAALWPHYLRRWALWNHVRMLASAIAGTFFILAIVAR